MFRLLAVVIRYCRFTYTLALLEKNLVRKTCGTRMRIININAQKDTFVRGWEDIAEFWYGTSRPNYWLGFSTSRLQKRED